MWKLNKSKVLIEDSPDEEINAQPDPQSVDQLLQVDVQSPVSQLATKHTIVQNAMHANVLDMEVLLRGTRGVLIHFMMLDSQLCKDSAVIQIIQ
ncbi:Hypothetical predicted protein [Pelobates cultripes]|nr:Hypothetical predicted protein [Pelobates cultripes]